MQEKLENNQTRFVIFCMIICESVSMPVYKRSMFGEPNFYSFWWAPRPVALFECMEHTELLRVLAPSFENNGQVDNEVWKSDSGPA